MTDLQQSSDLREKWTG